MENFTIRHSLQDFSFLGLLDRPVEIIETRRERKKVERLSLSNDAKSRKKEELDYSKVMFNVIMYDNICSLMQEFLMCYNL